MEKNSDDARRILQRKTSLTHYPAGILSAKHRIYSPKHRERLPRNYEKKNVECREDTFKPYRKTRKLLGYDKPQELISAEDEAIAIEPPPKQTKKGKRKQSTYSIKSNMNKKSKRAKK